MDNQKLAIHLIGEQIRNQVLILSLENLGFDCSIYTLNISENILTLVGFKNKTDGLYQRYFEMIENAIKEISYYNIDEMMNKWSKDIYFKLCDMKQTEEFL